MPEDKDASAQLQLTKQKMTDMHKQTLKATDHGECICVLETSQGDETAEGSVLL